MCGGWNLRRRFTDGRRQPNTPRTPLLERRSHSLRYVGGCGPDARGNMSKDRGRYTRGLRETPYTARSLLDRIPEPVVQVLPHPGNVRFLRTPASRTHAALRDSSQARTSASYHLTVE